jgi:hypothetical protein
VQLTGQVYGWGRDKRSLARMTSRTGAPTGRALPVPACRRVEHSRTGAPPESSTSRTGAPYYRRQQHVRAGSRCVPVGRYGWWPGDLAWNRRRARATGVPAYHRGLVGDELEREVATRIRQRATYCRSVRRPVCAAGSRRQQGLSPPVKRQACWLCGECMWCDTRTVAHRAREVPVNGGPRAGLPGEGLEGPLLVGGAGAGPGLQGRAVGGIVASDI